MRMRFVVVAVALQDTTGIVRHGCIAASFGNDDVSVVACVHIGVELIVGKECRERHRSVEDLNLRVLGPEEESGGIEGFGIKVGKDAVDQLLQFAVLRGIGERVNGKEHMELWPCRFTFFLLHMVAAEMDRKGDAGESSSDIRRINPLFGIFAVVVVAVDRQAV